MATPADLPPSVRLCAACVKVCEDHHGQVAISLAALHGEPTRGDHAGETPFYPASIVKLITLGYAVHQIERGELPLTEEIERALTDMTVRSSNDAANWILELLTGATSGPELDDEDLRTWMERRQAVNRWLQGLGFAGTNVCQKTWDDGPYGRERQGYGPKFELRNRLTPNDVRDFWLHLVRSNSTALRYLRREIPADSEHVTPQAANYVGAVLPSGSKLWSKAGWTSEVRHDSALVELPSGSRYVVVIFTKGFGEDVNPIPDLARKLFLELGEPLR